MEGLPAKHWQLLQQRHYKNMGKWKLTGQRWIKGLLKRLHELAWKQWDHRNHILHREDQPHQQRAIALLREDIIAEHQRGVEDLPVCNHGPFAISLDELLQKSTPFLKAWISNVHAAREAQARHRNEVSDARGRSRKRSRILHWIETNRLK